MYKFKKTDSREIEATLSIIVSLILLLIPFFEMLQWFDLFPYYWISTAEVIVVLGSCFLVIFLCMFFGQKENRYFTVLDLLLLGVMVSLILSTIFAKNPQLAISGNSFTMEGTVVNIAYLVMLFSCSLIQNSKYRRWIYVAAICVGVFEVFMGIMQSIVKSPVFLGDMEVDADGTARAYGSMMNQNPYGALMAMFAGLEMGLIFCSSNLKNKIIHGTLTILFVLALVLSGTRGAMVGLGCSCFVFSVLLIVKSKSDKSDLKKTFKLLGVIILIAAIGILIALLTAKGVATNTIDRTTSDVTADSVNALGSGRIGIWRGAWNNYVLEYPILGIGVSNFFLRLGTGFSYGFVAHNEYLDILCAQGIVGLVTYLLLEIYIFVFSIKRIKNAKEKKEWLGLLMAYTAYMVTAIFGWRIIYLTPYFYVLTGLMVSRTETKKLFKSKNTH